MLSIYVVYICCLYMLYICDRGFFWYNIKQAIFKLQLNFTSKQREAVLINLTFFVFVFMCLCRIKFWQESNQNVSNKYKRQRLYLNGVTGYVRYSWTEYAVLWKTSFGFIWDILNFLKICKSWVWAESRRSKSPFCVDTFLELFF